MKWCFEAGRPVSMLTGVLTWCQHCCVSALPVEVMTDPTSLNKYKPWVSDLCDGAVSCWFKSGTVIWVLKPVIVFNNYCSTLRIWRINRTSAVTSKRLLTFTEPVQTNPTIMEPNRSVLFMKCLELHSSPGSGTRWWSESRRPQSSPRLTDSRTEPGPEPPGPPGRGGLKESA